MISRIVSLCKIWALTSIVLGWTAAAGATCLVVSVPEGLEAPAGSILDVPIVVSPGLDGAGVIGFLVALQYDTTHLQFQEIRTCVGGVDYPSADWQPLLYNVIGSQLRVAGSGSEPLSGEGCMFVARFRIAADSSPSTCSSIDLVEALFNDGTPCTTLVDATACTACR